MSIHVRHLEHVWPSRENPYAGDMRQGAISISIYGVYSFVQFRSVPGSPKSIFVVIAFLAGHQTPRFAIIGASASIKEEARLQYHTFACLLHGAAARANVALSQLISVAKPVRWSSQRLCWGCLTGLAAFREVTTRVRGH